PCPYYASIMRRILPNHPPPCSLTARKQFLPSYDSSISAPLGKVLGDRRIKLQAAGNLIQVNWLLHGNSVCPSLQSLMPVSYRSADLYYPNDGL
ncbi:hypothetical protein M378DRAFT_154824, partial [Amanita muscaria Koide BX008]